MEFHAHSDSRLGKQIWQQKLLAALLNHASGAKMGGVGWVGDRESRGGGGGTNNQTSSDPKPKMRTKVMENIGVCICLRA